MAMIQAERCQAVCCVSGHDFFMVRKDTARIEKSLNHTFLLVPRIKFCVFFCRCPKIVYICN